METTETSTDLTALRDSLESADGDKGYLRAVLHQAVDAIIAIGVDGTIRSFNRAAEQIFGYRAADVIGRNVSMLMPEPHHSAHDGYLRHFHATKEAKIIGQAARELPARRADGTIFPIELAVSEVELPGDHFFVGLVRDVSERKRAEGTVLAAGRRAQLVIDSVPNGILGVNASGLITLANDTATKLFGYERAELVGQAIEILLPQAFRAGHPQLRAAFFANPQARAMGTGRDLFATRKDGSEFPVEIGLNPMETEGETWVLCSIVDISERKRAEAAVLAAGRRAQLVIDSVPNGILGVNASGLITLANDTATKLFGYERAELVGQAIEILLPQALRPGHPQLRSAFFANPQARAMGTGRDLFATRKDGSEFPVEIGLNPIETEGETWVLCSIVDITERKRAEGKNALLAAIVDSSDDAIISKTLQSTITSWNAGAERLFGFSAAEVIGRHIGIITPPGQTDEAYILNRLKGGEHVAHFETLRQHKSGKTVPVSLNVSPLLDAGGQLVGASSIARDITHHKMAILERKRAEQELRDNATRMAAIMNTVVDGLITIDEQGNINSFNLGAERIFGYTEAETLGQNVKFLMPEPYHGAHDGYLRNYQETGRKTIIGGGREVSAKRKDGTVFPMDLSVGEMFLHDRRMYVGILRDITARKQVEDDRSNLIATLKQSNQELDDFAYIASHDLKEPLRGLFNNAQFLKEDYAGQVDEVGIKRLDRICFLCNRMERLIDNLLYFSRLGRQDLAYRNTDLNAVVHDILEQSESTSGQPGVSVKVNESLPGLVCDSVRIGEVFRNLIANAIKYNNKPEKRVEIGHLREYAGQRNVLYVRDNGIGIPPEFQNEVFTIFKRLHPEDDAVRGSGVGLTFAKKIVERHGGHIWIESQEGQGTTFFFTIREGHKI